MMEQAKKAGRKPKGADKAAAAERTLKITLVGSLIGYPRLQREVAKGLGLRKLQSCVIRRESPEILGMVRRISHALKVEAVEKR